MCAPRRGALRKLCSGNAGACKGELRLPHCDRGRDEGVGPIGDWFGLDDRAGRNEDVSVAGRCRHQRAGWSEVGWPDAGRHVSIEPHDRRERKARIEHVRDQRPDDFCGLSARSIDARDASLTRGSAARRDEDPDPHEIHQHDHRSDLEREPRRALHLDDRHDGHHDVEHRHQQPRHRRHLEP